MYIKPIHHFITKVSFFVLFICGSALADNANWMRDYKPFIGKIPLANVFLPGSNGSGTSAVKSTDNTKTSQLDNVYLNWSKVQKLNVTEQLEVGVRFLEFKVAWKESEADFFVFNGIFGNKFIEELKQIRGFLTAHPEEIVIINVLNDLAGTDPNSHALLISLIYSILDPLLIQHDENDDTGYVIRPKTNFTPKQVAPITLVPIQTLLDMGKQQNAGYPMGRVIVIYDMDERFGYTKMHKFLWPKKILEAFWVNVSTSPAQLKEKLDVEIANKKSPPLTKLSAIQAHLTPDTQTIEDGINMLIGNKPRSAEDLAEMVKCYLPNWIDEWATKQQAKIIIHDFVTSETADWIIKKNNPANMMMGKTPQYQCPPSIAALIKKPKVVIQPNIVN